MKSKCCRLPSLTTLGPAIADGASYGTSTLLPKNNSLERLQMKGDDCVHRIPSVSVCFLLHLPGLANFHAYACLSIWLFAEVLRNLSLAVCKSWMDTYHMFDADIAQSSVKNSR